jgi:hypothetical protein
MLLTKLGRQNKFMFCRPMSNLPSYGAIKLPAGTGTLGLVLPVLM